MLAKILFWDIETWGLNFNADTGFIMVISYKWKGEKEVHSIVRRNPREWTRKLFDDKDICLEFAKVFAQADLHVTWNGTRFDLPFLQTRMLKYRLGYLPPVPHEDGLRTARRALKMRRSLDNVQKFFNLDTKKEEMNFTDVWMPAAMGDPVALRQVVRRCEADVKLLEEAYNLISPMSKVHPNVAVINGKPEGCPFCGASGLMQKRGTREQVQILQQKGTIHALRHYRIRFHCQKCGRWSSSDPIKTQRRK